MIVLTIVKL